MDDLLAEYGIFRASDCPERVHETVTAFAGMTELDLLIRPANGFSVGRPSGRLVGLKPDPEAKQYRAGGIIQRFLKETLNNVTIPSNPNPSFKNSALKFQDEAGFA